VAWRAVAGLPQWLYLWLAGIVRPALVSVIMSACATLTKHPHRINVVVDDHCLVDAKGDANHGIRIVDGVFIGRTLSCRCHNG